MTLESWLELSGLSVPAFASQIGVKSVKSVYRYMNGERTPDKAVMNRIIAATKGAVTANDFYGAAQ